MTDKTTSDTSPSPMDIPLAHPPLLPLTTNTAIATTNAPKNHVKNSLCLLYSHDPDVFSPPTNKWSATTHPIKARVIGFLGYHISYKHFYFHQSRILLTKAFATSTMASTVGDGGISKGSTELDAICGSNCAIEDDKFPTFARLVLGLCLRKQHGTEPKDRSFVNMLLDDFVAITNLTAVFALNEPDDRCALAHRLARFSLLLLGAKVLTPTIIAKVWGENDKVHCNLGGPRGDLALIH